MPSIAELNPGNRARTPEVDTPVDAIHDSREGAQVGVTDPAPAASNEVPEAVGESEPAITPERVSRALQAAYYAVEHSRGLTLYLTAFSPDGGPPVDSQLVVASRAEPIKRFITEHVEAGHNLYFGCNAIDPGLLRPIEK